MLKLQISLQENQINSLVIIGPCSADNEDAVCDYTLAALQKYRKKVADKTSGLYQEYIYQ